VPVDVSLPEVGRARGRRDLEIVRSCGAGVTILLGPAAGLAAWLAFDMGFMEIAAVVFLISGWLGPRLMRLDWT
jgi:hypothetical protein